MDHRFSDMESGTQRTSPHPSVGSRNLSGTLARRAISAIRRAFTPTTPVCDLSTGPDPTAPSVPESILWRGRSNAGADSSHHVRISEPDYVLYQAPHETTVKPLSDLAGRLKLTTEIVSVQVGILPGLRRPMLAFIRLQRALFAYGLTELRDSHPVRFLILFFGPERRHLDYSEVGRVIATMMVDKAFRRTAYTAVSREDLMDGLRTFLDTTIVLPMLSDITPKSLLAMNDQLRLFRRHQLNAMRETKNATTVPHSGLHPPSLALFGARKRSYTRGDSKLNDVAMDPSIATIQTSVPELVITPPLMYESAAAARVKREMCRPFDHIRNVNRESSAPLLQTSSMLDFRSAEDRMNRYTPASSSGISHKSARNQ
ncbi:Anion exchange protein 2 [Fasciola hepatica]|uniref:Anion exchange protein 2 n=1 Tax=Fasciola hepatica TaxID=6192 RepID=A0A4E0R1F6_FASHE|nr:Anion exchange protein 2 [Fasciola hepatica]